MKDPLYLFESRIRPLHQRAKINEFGALEVSRIGFRLKLDIIIGNIGNNVKFRNSVITQLHLDGSGWVDIVQLDVAWIESGFLDSIQDFPAIIVNTDSGYKPYGKTELFQVVGKVEGRPPKAFGFRKYIKQDLSNHKDHKFTY